MTNLVLNDDQTRLLSEASFPIVIVDSHGNKVTEIAAAPVAKCTSEMSEDEWVAEALRRRDRMRAEGSSGVTTKELLARLQALKPI